MLGTISRISIIIAARGVEILLPYNKEDKKDMDLIYKVGNKSVKYQAYVDKNYFTKDRIAVRLVYNDTNLLFIWTKGYDMPKPYMGNEIKVNPAMAEQAFRSLGLVSGAETPSQNQVSSPVESKEIKDLQMQMQLMQKQMEMMAASNLQMAQMIQSTITMNSVQMSMSNSQSSVAPVEEEGMSFNFDVECEEDDIYFEEIEENVSVGIVSETKVEVIEDKKPKRRAANRD